MNILNISRREKAEENFKYGKVTVTLGVNELGLLKNALYGESERNPAEVRSKLLAELQVAFDLLEYGGIDSFMIGIIAKNLGVVSEEYLDFRKVKQMTDDEILDTKHLDEVSTKFKEKEGLLMDYCYVLTVDCEWFEFEHKPLDDEDGIYICWSKEDVYKKAKELFGDKYSDDYENRYFFVEQKKILGELVDVKGR